MKRFGWWLCVVVSCGSLWTPAAAQEAPGNGDLLNLYFDCQGMGCYDLDYFRREIPVVNWVRDRQVADLHVLVTSQGTGGGGALYTLSFLGRGDFEGQDQELTASSSGDATQDDQRSALSGVLKLGLVRYLVGTPAAEQIRVSMGPEGGAQGQGGGPGRPGGGPPGSGNGAEQDDPWDYWVFTVRGNGRMNGESSFSGSSFSGNFSANRTTEMWKFNASARFSRNESTFQISEDSEVVSLREDWNASSLLVRSLSPQWSMGARAGAGKSTFLNEDFRWNFSPGFEYNFFPYVESSRRALTLQALVNVRHWDYIDETIYGETAETRLAASLTASLNQIQPWGRMNLSLNGSQYLHDSNLNSVSIGGFVEVRLFKGFSVNINGNYAWIRDQLYPASGGASSDEILTRQKALQTSYNYFTSFGVSYRFGSIFNNVVNPRFGGGGGERFFFF